MFGVYGTPFGKEPEPARTICTNIMKTFPENFILTWTVEKYSHDNSNCKYFSI